MILLYVQLNTFLPLFVLIFFVKSQQINFIVPHQNKKFVFGGLEKQKRVLMESEKLV